MFNKNFYPTPGALIEKMIAGIEFTKIKYILEPSAGKGNIIDLLNNKLKNDYAYKHINYDIDCIEVENELQHILKGKNYRVVYNDFLNYNTYKKYDLIIMNPPFDNGDKHLLKAIELIENKGGQIVCLLNAETINNTYTNIRKELLQKLEDLNANIECIKDAFMDAERKTNIEIALIKININKENKLEDSFIFNELKQKERITEAKETTENFLTENDFLGTIIKQYNFEIGAGIKLINEYNSLSKVCLCSFNKDNYKSSNSIIQLNISNHNKDYNISLENSYIKEVRSKYWEALFENKQFTGLFTSNLRQKYNEMINDLCNYDFNYYNIATIKIQMNSEMVKGVEETIINLFEEMSNKHHYYNEMSKNIHMYNGWKTNKGHKINKKVILPLNAYNWYNKSEMDIDYKVRNKLEDIEKVFNYLDNGITESINLENVLNIARREQQNKKIETKYFTIDFYKKGTAHLTFKNEDLLLKFNVFAGKYYNWLPPVYGKFNYKDMDIDSKKAVDEFQGEKEYNKIINNTGYYITNLNNLLMLQA